jgi:hypothetical protein
MDMDDATYKHLIQKRIHYEKPKMEIGPYKTQILDLTKQLFDHKMGEGLQTAFDNYVAECIHHLNQKKEEIVLQPPLPVDTIMYKPKKVNVFLKKK